MRVIEKYVNDEIFFEFSVDFSSRCELIGAGAGVVQRVVDAGARGVEGRWD